MQIKCKERKRPEKLGFIFYFFPIKAKLTKDAKRNYKIHDSFFLKIQAKNKPKNLGNTKKENKRKSRNKLKMNL
jgi:hypothetical protein